MAAKARWIEITLLYMYVYQKNTEVADGAGSHSNGAFIHTLRSALLHCTV